MASDPSTWREYRHFLDTEYVQRFKRYQEKLNGLCNYEPQPPRQPVPENADYFAKSPYLNVFDFPSELAYDEIVPKPDNCLQFEAFFRPDSSTAKVEYHLPEGFASPSDKLIYLSMGSYGGIDVELMKRLVSILAQTPHKYIVSKGLRADEYELPAENCIGEAFLPQTSILPLVDLVITHGGK